MVAVRIIKYNSMSATKVANTTNSTVGQTKNFYVQRTSPDFVYMICVCNNFTKRQIIYYPAWKLSCYRSGIYFCLEHACLSYQCSTCICMIVRVLCKCNPHTHAHAHNHKSIDFDCGFKL